MHRRRVRVERADLVAVDVEHVHGASAGSEGEELVVGADAGRRVLREDLRRARAQTPGPAAWKTDTATMKATSSPR